MISDLIRTNRLLLVCGSGGVGKTTLSASLAVKAALMGKKTIVVTIDPAKRLAASLGLKEFLNQPTQVDFEEAGSKASFDAMMLDIKSTFDHIIAQYAPSQEARERILNNKIYQHLSALIVGSQEYMAMEALYEFYQASDYELIIVDTPPTVHAVDFLEAPQKMVNAIGHSMLHLLLKPAAFVGKSSFKIFEKSSQLVFKILDRIIGFAFLQEISEMLIAFQDLLGGFAQRAKEVEVILRAEGTQFILVTACEEKSINEARYFSDKLKALKLHLAGVLLNRVHQRVKRSQQELERDRERLAGLVGASLAEVMMECFENYQLWAKRDRHYTKEIRSLLTEGQFLHSIPLFDEDIHDLPGLVRLSKLL